MNRSEIIARIINEHAAFIQFVEHLSEEQLWKSKPNKWNAVLQAEHLYLCLRPVNLALALPKWLPVLLFGQSKSGSRTYERLVAAYQLKLQTGGKASGTYVPKKSRQNVKRILQRLQRLVDKLVARLDKYDEHQLDTLRLPHPLLGKLTLRELLYFTIYHVGHHHRQAEEQIK